MNACSVPPKIPHAVIVHQDYQEVFAAGSEVQYECEDGYTAEGAHNKKSVCTQGSWTQGPTCMGGMGTGHHDPAVSGGQPTGGGRETTGHQGASSSTFDSNNRDSKPILMNVRSCGARPSIENAVIVEEGPMYLKYQCKSYYRLVGLDTVSCYSDGSWSELPTCEEAFCVVDPARSAGYGLVVTQSEYIREGEEKGFHCTTRGLHAFVRCTNRKIVLTRCCSDYGHRYHDDCRRFS